MELIWSRGRWREAAEREQSRDQVEVCEERRLGLKEELRMRVETGSSLFSDAVVSLWI